MTTHREPEQMEGFVQLLSGIDASVVVHGHAHIGVDEGRTPSGIPVFNVALPLLRRSGEGPRIWTTTAADRRSVPV